MTKRLTEAVLLDALAKGVARTTDFIARLTEYHGGPVETEYLLTADIAREFVEREFHVKVEALNRRLVNAMTSLNGAKPRKILRSKRTDVVVMEGFIPAAMIELKIRINSFAGLEEDLDKITQTIRLMKSSSAAKVSGVSLFQVHIPGARHRLKAEDFKSEALRVEDKIRADLARYAAGHGDFSFQMHSLQSEDDGIVGCDLEFIGGEFVWGIDGHATRYHAILIRSTRSIEAEESTLSALRQRSRSVA